MSSEVVLYDVPGPRAKRRQAVAAIVAGLATLGVLGLVVYRLDQQNQFDGALWGPLIDPRNESFAAVWGLIGEGFLSTMKAAALAIVFSLALGTVIGISRLMLGRVSRIPVVGFIELFRGLPVVVSIFFASRVLPDLGVDLSGWPGGEGLWFVVIGLTAYNSVILAEILRSGVNALPRGQGEAAMAIGLSNLATMRLILLPQAVRIMLPALISQLVVILKDTSLAAVLGVYPELLNAAKIIYLNLGNPIQALFVVGTIFVVINFGLSKLANWVEYRMSHSGRSPGKDTDNEVRYLTDSSKIVQ